MTTAAIYARVSGRQQKEEQTIGSQLVECRQAATSWGLEVPKDWVFTDEGYTGATLVRPALERLRDLAAQVPVEVVMCYSPDRLARKLAYQTLLIDEFNKAGTEVRFVKARKVETPEDEMLLQFQGMMAEYERALIMNEPGAARPSGLAPEWPTFSAAPPSVTATFDAPTSPKPATRSSRTKPTSCARCSAATSRSRSLSASSRGRLTAEGIPTRTGKARWDRSVIWLMLRNPAYVGRAAYLKTGTTDRRPATNRQARLQGRSVSRIKPTATVPPRSGSPSRFRPSSTRTPSPSPPIVWQTTAASRQETAKNPACSWDWQPARCGYAYYRTSTRTAKRKIYYYRCLGSDDYRYQGGRVRANQPVRADYLDEVVWTHVTALLADPTLVQLELDRRLAELRATNPATAERARLERDHTRTTKAIYRLVQAYQEDLLTLNELRARTPDLRAKQAACRPLSTPSTPLRSTTRPT